MPLKSLFQRRRREHCAERLYLSAVEQARQPVFYRALGVADSVDGRFDMVVLHVFLLMRRLGGVTGTKAEAARALSQALFDLMFADMDRSLREMGVGDLSVGKKVRVMSEAFFGRVAAYDRAFADSKAAVEDALIRNLWRADAPAGETAGRVADYLIAQAAHLQCAGDGDVLEGNVEFLSAET